MRVVDVNETAPSLKAGKPLLGLTNFGVIKRENRVSWPFETGEISIHTQLFRALLRLALEHVRVDERYYLRSYPDVGVAIENGSFTDPRHHYVEFGYFEDRLPFKIDVDEEFYFRANPDIKAGVRGGLIPSAQVHFERHGYEEGRLPREGWSLLGS
jgi:hypothetical protein